jgi:hypothetical protein
MFGRFRVLVSVSAAFPFSATDGEVVYNYRGSVDTANFLGQLFRTLGQVLHLSPQAQQPQDHRPENSQQNIEIPVTPTKPPRKFFFLLF